MVMKYFEAEESSQMATKINRPVFSSATVPAPKSRGNLLGHFG
jgi:hypothetical protein